MKVRATIPLRAYLVGDDAQTLSPTAVFEYKKLIIRIEFFGDAVASLPGPSVQHFRQLRGMQIDITGDERLQALLAPGMREALLRHVVTVANRVSSAIRNFGTVAHIQPLKVTSDQTDAWLRALQVETSEDGQSWTAVVPQFGLGQLEDLLAERYLLVQENIADLRVSEWPLIEEAIQDDLSAGPEREFYTNAVEHSRVGNLRLAVVEVVVCLEIVLAQWLQRVLPTRNVKNAKDLLTPQLDLSTRLKLVLPLLLSTKQLEKLRLDDVARTISLRNKVAHETGNLPSSVPEKTVREGIQATLGLVTRLAFERDKIARQPALNALAEAIGTSLELPTPKAYWSEPHEYSIVFDFPDSSKLPGDDRLLDIAQRVDRKLVEFDYRFRPLGDASVVFTINERLVVIWTGGQLKKIHTLRDRLVRQLLKGESL